MKLARHHHIAHIGIIVVALAAVLGLARPALASPAFDAANHTFAEGHYADAAAQYRALIDQEGYSAPALFNLGNAYLREGKPVDAMVAYERARLLAPRDGAITSNLAEARAAAGITDDQGLVHRVSHVLTTTEWTWLATLAFWLAVLGATGAWLAPRRRAWLVRTAAVGVVVCVVSVAALGASSSDQRAALAIRAAPVLVSPFDGAESSFSLRAGSRVELQRTHEGYVQVREADGRSGWVERAVVAPLSADGATLGG